LKISDAEISLGNDVRKSQTIVVIVNGNPHAGCKRCNKGRDTIKTTKLVHRIEIP